MKEQDWESPATEEVVEMVGIGKGAIQQKTISKSLLYKPTWMLQTETAKDLHYCCSVLSPDRYSGLSPGTNYSGQPLFPSGWHARIVVGIHPGPCVLCGSFPHLQLWSGALGGMNGKGWGGETLEIQTAIYPFPYTTTYYLYSLYDLILRTYKWQRTIKEIANWMASLVLQI